MLIGFDKLTNSRFTGDGELPVIQSVHNEELAALKLKIKKVALCKIQSSPSLRLKSCLQMQEDNRRMTNLVKEKDAQVSFSLKCNGSIFNHDHRCFATENRIRS